MTILWILLFVYLGLTWAFSIWALTCCVPEGEEYEKLAAERGYSRLGLKCVTFALVPLLGPLLPIIGIGCFIKQFRYRRELIKMSRLHFPPQHRRMRCDALPVNVQQAIKAYSTLR